MKVRFKGYVPETLPSGEVRHRVRVEGQPGRRIRIPVGPDDPAFSEHYCAARVGQTPDQPKPRPPVARLSADELVRDYLDWVEAQVAGGMMSAMTLKQRRSLMARSLETLDHTGERIGALHMDLPSEAFVLIRDGWGARTAQADNALKAFSAAYKWAIERGRAQVNPLAGVRRVHIPKGGATPWSATDLKAFLKQHGPGSPARRWLFLALFTACRIGDVILLGRQHEVKHDDQVWLDWQPGKKGSAFVSIPMAPQLLNELRSATIEGPTYLLTTYGKPYKTPESFRRMVQAWTTQAGMEGRSQHGVRKAMGELLAESGCSQHQIMAVMAHTKPNTSAIYTQNADRRRLAALAMEGIRHIQM